MSEQTGTETLRIQRTFRAPRQAVFEAWTDELVLSRWFHAGRDWETVQASVDLRVGGALRLAMRDPAAGATHAASGRYTEVDPPARLAFTWSWDESAKDTLIEIDFERVGDEETLVRFTHSKLPDEHSRLAHEGGWEACFANLQEQLVGEW